MSGKLPWIQFYPAAWTGDTRMLNLEAKGAWIEILIAMWNSSRRGVLSGNLEELSLLLGCYTSVTESLLERFERHKICDVERFSNGIVTLRCRRMIREELTRENCRERVSRHREKQTCNGNVTPQKLEVRIKKEEKEEEKKGKQSVSPKQQTFEDLISEMKTIYTWIDIDVEVCRMKAWQTTPRGRGKELSRQRVINWLNKIDPPLLNSENGNGHHLDLGCRIMSAEECWEAEQKSERSNR